MREILRAIVRNVREALRASANPWGAALGAVIGIIHTVYIEVITTQRPINIDIDIVVLVCWTVTCALAWSNKIVMAIAATGFIIGGVYFVAIIPGFRLSEWPVHSWAMIGGTTGAAAAAFLTALIGWLRKILSRLSETA